MSNWWPTLLENDSFFSAKLSKTDLSSVKSNLGSSSASYPYKVMKFMPKCESWLAYQESLANLQRPVISKTHVQCDELLNSISANFEGITMRETLTAEHFDYSVFNRDRKYTRNLAGLPDVLLKVRDVSCQNWDFSELNLNFTVIPLGVSLVLALYDCGDVSFYSVSGKSCSFP